jgi:rhodanese-related sulfurtransferase
MAPASLTRSPSTASLATAFELTSFKVETTDGSVGKIDEATYETGASYLVVDTGPWILGRKVMLPAGVIECIDPDERKVYALYCGSGRRDVARLADGQLLSIAVRQSEQEIDSPNVADRTETVEDLLSEARRGLDRLSPGDALAATRHGAVLVDIRSDSQRASDGVIPAAVFVARNVLEWRLDPSCEQRDPMLARRDHRVIVICNEGYQSSLAAANLRRLGLDASDVIGGFQAWREAGLPVAQPERTKRG